MPRFVCLSGIPGMTSFADLHDRLKTAPHHALFSGTPVDLALPAASGKLRAVPWLPCDEALVKRLVHSVGVLLALG